MLSYLGKVKKFFSVAIQTIELTKFVFKLVRYFCSRACLECASRPEWTVS